MASEARPYRSDHWRKYLALTMLWLQDLQRDLALQPTALKPDYYALPIH